MKVLVGAMAWGAVMLLAPVSIALDHEPAPSWPVLAGLLALALVATLVGWMLGRRVRPLHIETPAPAAWDLALARLRSSTVLAAVVTESVAVIATLVGFLLTRGPLVTVLPALIVAPALIILTAWPTRARLDALATSLRSAGYAGQLPLDDQVTYR